MRIFLFFILLFELLYSYSGNRLMILPVSGSKELQVKQQKAITDVVFKNISKTGYWDIIDYNQVLHEGTFSLELLKSKVDIILEMNITKKGDLF